MDCGPAALKCLRKAIRLRRAMDACEAYQTEVDGTTSPWGDVAQLGLVAEQIMLPADVYCCRAGAASPVSRSADGLAHFVVAWRRHGRIIQVMDPGVGRRWVPQQRFLKEVYRHTMTVPAQAWREWAGSEGLCAPLRHRLAAVGLDAPAVTRLLEEACEDPGWASRPDAAHVWLMSQRAGPSPGETRTTGKPFFQQARPGVRSPRTHSASSGGPTAPPRGHQRGGRRAAQVPRGCAGAGVRRGRLPCTCRGWPASPGRRHPAVYGG
jgi:hypothetical protein